jgi:tetratricopeptide (TPR) repeat protein
MDNADEGQRLCSRCAALDPSIYECYEALAYNLLQRSPEGAKVARLEALLPMHPETAESLATLSGFHRWQGRKVEAVSAAEGAVKLSSSRADRGMLARSEFELADALAMEPGAERETAIEHAEAACAAAMESGDPDLELNICGKAARNYSRDAASRDERLTALIDEATGLSHHRWEGTLRSWRAEDLSRAGRAEEALEESRLAAEAMDRTGDPDNSGLVWRLRGEMQARLGDADGAALSMEEALRAAERQGSEAARSFVLSKLTVIHNQAGRGLEAIRTAEEAVRLFRALGMDRQAGAELSDVGWAYLTLGDYETAVRYFRESLESGRWFQDASEVARNSNFLAEAYLESGQPGKARVVLLAATESLKMAKDRNFYLRFHTLLGEAHSRLGDGAAAGRAFGTAFLEEWGPGEGGEVL